MKNLNDILIFRSIKNGSKEALSELFLKYYDRLVHYGLKVSRDKSLVEECIHELFLYIFETHDRLGNVLYVRSYLFKSLRRRLIKKINSERQRLTTSIDISDFTNIEFYSEDLHLEILNIETVNTKVVSILNGLPERQKEAIYLRYYNELSTKEVAEIMGVTNQTILNTIHQALTKIRRNKEMLDQSLYL